MLPNSSPNTTSGSDPARSSSTGSTSSGFSSDIHRWESYFDDHDADDGYDNDDHHNHDDDDDHDDYHDDKNDDNHTSNELSKGGTKCADPCECFKPDVEYTKVVTGQWS